MEKARFAAPASPLYCPRCRRVESPPERLCHACGDELRAQGYCPICEGWMTKPPGSPCPKHEVELLDGPTEPDFDPSSTRLVTITSFGLPSEALGPKLRLEAEGIPTFLLGERMGANAIYQVATGGVRLQVPEEFAGEALRILSQTWSPPKGEGDDPDDPWEGLGPDPAERRRSVMKGAILVFLFGPLLFGLIGVILSALTR